MKKVTKTNVFTIIFAIILLSVYPIYAIIVWNISKSPDDFSLFPKSGIWICENENFNITIDLNNEEDNEILSNGINAKSITISIDDVTFNLDCFINPGHGTILAPVAPTTIINFKTMGDLSEEVYNKYNVNFSVSKYKFNTNDFYLKNINISKNNKLNFLTENMTLHFVKVD